MQKLKKKEIYIKYKKYFLIMRVFEGFEQQGYGVSSVVEDISGMTQWTDKRHSETFPNRRIQRWSLEL